MVFRGWELFLFLVIVISPFVGAILWGRINRDRCISYGCRSDGFNGLQPDILYLRYREKIDKEKEKEKSMKFVIKDEKKTEEKKPVEVSLKSYGDGDEVHICLNSVKVAMFKRDRLWVKNNVNRLDVSSMRGAGIKTECDEVSSRICVTWLEY